MRHLRAIAVLLVGLWLLLLGTPGLDFIQNNRFEKPQDRARDPVMTVFADINRVRVDLIRPLEPPQRPFRIAQSWSLYRDGPAQVRRLEVYVDGELRHRSLDDEADWLNPVLRARRIRPVVESTCRYDNHKARNWKGLTRLIGERAAEDFGATHVELVCTKARFPGADAEVAHRMEARAPEWTPRRLP